MVHNGTSFHDGTLSLFFALPPFGRDLNESSLMKLTKDTPTYGVPQRTGPFSLRFFYKPTDSVKKKKVIVVPQGALKGGRPTVYAELVLAWSNNRFSYQPWFAAIHSFALPRIFVLPASLRTCRV